MAVSTPQAERYLALELVGVMLVRTIAGFQEQQNLLGPANFAAMTAAYGMLAGLVLWEPAAGLAATMGLLLFLSVLLRKTPTGTIGGDTARAVARFTERTSSAPPTVARGVTAK